MDNNGQRHIIITKASSKFSSIFMFNSDGGGGSWEEDKTSFILMTTMMLHFSPCFVVFQTVLLVLGKENTIPARNGNFSSLLWRAGMEQ